MTDEKFLKQLSKEFPTVKDACVEIINLKAILSLPKGTEYFFSDLHGEHEAFIYMLKSASGVIREKIDWLFSKSMSVKEREELSALIYYPELKLAERRNSRDYNDFCKVTIYRLIDVCRQAANKYTRSKVRKRLPKGFDYIMDELLHADDEDNKAFYYSEIINSLIETEMAEEFIKQLCATISRLAVDRLHILGDLFDRGPHPDYIMDYLINYDNVDFQWGNHDIVWMGAALGDWACIANVLRISMSYNNFDMLEIGYSINLRPLAVYASQVYENDPCERFAPHVFEQNKYDPVDLKLAAKMHKAIAVLQFKLEGALVNDCPEFGMGNRTLFNSVNFKDGTVRIQGKDYPMRDNNFPTIDPLNPNKLTDDEADLMSRIAASFKASAALKKHINFLFSHGALYKTYNGNLMYHGCIPMTEGGEFDEVSTEGGKKLSGKAYFDYIDRAVRKTYFSWREKFNSAHADAESNPESDGRRSATLMWKLWSGGKSPVFGKETITTFERYFVEDKATHFERPDYYYHHINNKEVCEKILSEFGLDKTAHIINGHIPVKTKQGESPIKGGGRLIVIDGGMAKSYQRTTGIAGYTLIYNSRYLSIAEHKPFDGKNYQSPKIQLVEAVNGHRLTINDSDIGRELKSQIKDLEELIAYFKSGAL